MQFSDDVIDRILDKCPFDIYVLSQVNKHFHEFIKTKYKTIKPINNYKKCRVPKINDCVHFCKAYPILIDNMWISATCLIPEVRSIVLISLDNHIPNMLMKAYEVESCQLRILNEKKYKGIAYSKPGENIERLIFERERNYNKALIISESLLENPIENNIAIGMNLNDLLNLIIKFDPIFYDLDISELYYDVGYKFGNIENYAEQLFMYEKNKLNFELEYYISHIHGFNYMSNDILLTKKPNEKLEINLYDKKCSSCDKNKSISKGIGYNDKIFYFCENCIGIDVCEFSLSKLRVMCLCKNKSGGLCRNIASSFDSNGKPICKRHKNKLLNNI